MFFKRCGCCEGVIFADLIFLLLLALHTCFNELGETRRPCYSHHPSNSKPILTSVVALSYHPICILTFKLFFFTTSIVMSFWISGICVALRGRDIVGTTGSGGNSHKKQNQITKNNYCTYIWSHFFFLVWWPLPWSPICVGNKCSLHCCSNTIKQ